MSVARCVHVTLRQPSLSEMIASREAGRDGDALTQAADTTYTVWQPEFPRRDKPNDAP